MMAGGCRHLDRAEPVGHLYPKQTKTNSVYTQACTTMATAGTMDEFAAALSSLDLTGLDVSKENPQGLISALHHGVSLMKTADLKAEAEARKNRSRENQLKLKIQALEQDVKILRHQILVLENIDQERQEKRKTQ